MKRIYLDYAATTPMHPEVIKVMQPYFDGTFGNPSSINSFGREAKEAVEKSRQQVAALLNAQAEEIVFTGSGTEADNLALIGVAFANEDKGNHIITSSVEHHAVLETCKFLERRGFKITYLPVDRYGQISPEDVKKAITDQTILVSVMYANNEIGTIEPIPEIARITKDYGVYFHTDAVQAVGHLQIDVNQLGVDLLSFSGHKLYGPKGVGALFIKDGTKIEPFIRGGAQENNKRASTENVPGIVGLARACELALAEMEEESKRLLPLRDKLISGLLKKVEYCSLNGSTDRRLPNNVNISIKFVEGGSVCRHLDVEGICLSTASACSSASKEPSHVLTATGLSRSEASGSVRFTLGKWTLEEDINRVLEMVPLIVEKLVDGRLSGNC